MVNKLVYRDFDEFAESLVGIDGHVIPTARQTSEWWIERADGGGNWLEAFQMGGPATFAGQGKSGHLTVAVPITQSGHLRVNGSRLEPDEFVLLGEEQPFTFAWQDVVRWVGITVPKNTTLIDPDLLHTRPNSGSRLRTSMAQLNRFRAMVSRIIFHKEHIETGDPAASLMAAQKGLALCLTRLLEHSIKPPDRPVTRPPLSRRRVIARTLALIEAQQGEPLFIADLCRATQVSERTLRNIFCEYFGVGPMRLLKAIQLHSIRTALLRADLERDTVTNIAGRFGIWDFSLFARNYKAMFSELPSTTLRTPPPPAYVQSKSVPVGWLQYASQIVMGEGTLLGPRLRKAGDEAP